jgi:hypothetical protein
MVLGQLSTETTLPVMSFIVQKPGFVSIKYCNIIQGVRNLTAQLKSAKAHHCHNADVNYKLRSFY